jgi:hypothetical protein
MLSRIWDIPLFLPLCLVDYRKGGMITDDEISAHIVETLPDGVRLTAVMDSCHSGTGNTQVHGVWCLRVLKSRAHDSLFLSQVLTCPTAGTPRNAYSRKTSIPTTLWEM